MRKAFAILLVPCFLAACLESDQREAHVWQQRQPIPGAGEFDPPPAICAAMSSTLTVIDRFGQPETAFIQGELINLQMLVRNNSSATVVLTNPNGCPSVRFEVVNGANEVVATSDDGFACIQVQTPVEYAPGESTLHTWTWDQVMRDDAPAPMGDYTVYADERTECRFALSKSAPLSIR